jgi:hypothetical protein
LFTSPKLVKGAPASIAVELILALSLTIKSLVDISKYSIDPLILPDKRPKSKPMFLLILVSHVRFVLPTLSKIAPGVTLPLAPVKE